MKNKKVKKQKRIFLDYASVTPIDARVKKVVSEAEKFWGNPSSLHFEGEEAKKILDENRKRLAMLLHCRASEIFFTSGATESLNIAITGVVKAAEKEKVFPHIIISSIEHSAALEPVKNLIAEKRVEVSFISPTVLGEISPETIKKELKANTVLVIVQFANSEIGTIQPIQKIAEIVKNFRNKKIGPPYFLVDSGQAALFENVSLERLQADILIIDGMKIYGPRGIGILVLRHGTKISPIMYGGGQENGLRPGTENIPAIAGLTKALEIAAVSREADSKRLSTLRNYVITKLFKEIPRASLNGDSKNRLPNNINICLPAGASAKEGLAQIDSEFLVIKLDTLGFAVSAASACETLGNENSSYVIQVLGKPECASSSLRITLGRETKKSDIDALVSVLKKILK